MHLISIGKLKEVSALYPNVEKVIETFTQKLKLQHGKT